MAFQKYRQHVVKRTDGNSQHFGLGRCYISMMRKSSTCKCNNEIIMGSACSMRMKENELMSTFFSTYDTRRSDLNNFYKLTPAESDRPPIKILSLDCLILDRRRVPHRRFQQSKVLAVELRFYTGTCR